MRHQDFALIFAASLPHLRRIAREKGYALAVHGSMIRDLDLIACPWTEQAESADDLVEAIREAVGGHYRIQEGRPYLDDPNPSHRPHGRMAWSIYVKEFGGNSTAPYIDISVMPRITGPKD